MWPFAYSTAPQTMGLSWERSRANYRHETLINRGRTSRKSQSGGFESFTTRNLGAISISFCIFNTTARGQLKHLVKQWEVRNFSCC